MSVNLGDYRGDLVNCWRSFGIKYAFTDPFNVRGDAVDAMTVYAAEISLDKRTCNDCGMGWRHPIALQDGFDEGCGFPGVDFKVDILRYSCEHRLVDDYGPQDNFGRETFSLKLKLVYCESKKQVYRKPIVSCFQEFIMI